MSHESDQELLFFDTFAQTDVNEGPNLGLVQFPNPIVIKEIRVVPLGVRVEADFPGGVRLGATIPSAFELQFFINDLTRRNTCTFLDIGTLDYKQNVSINFVPKESIPTDGLILRGMYSTLTLAVFGYIADISSIIAQDAVSESSNSVTENIIKSVPFDHKDVPLTETIDNLAIDEQKVNQILQTLSETNEESVKKRHSPTVRHRSENKGSRTSSPISELSEIKRKEKPIERSSRSRHRSKDRTQSRRSPLLLPKGRSRSKSRSGTPSSLKRYRYSHKSPPPYERSPKRQRSPRRRSRSPSPRSPHFSSKALCRTSLSPPSRPLSPRRRSLTKSPIKDVDSFIDMIPVKSEPKTNTDNLAFDDSELFEPLSPENSLSDIAEKISDDENLDQILAEDEPSEEQSKDALEEISSEEEYEDEVNVDSDLIDYNDEFNAYMDFNPFQCEFTSLQVLKDPSLTSYEMSSLDDNEIETKLNLLIQSNEERNDKWVESIEQISTEISKTMLKDETTVKSLIEFVVDGIDFDLAMKQTNTAYKVRHLKAGIKLLIALSQTNEDMVKRLIDLNVINTLLELYNRPYMTIPVRLLIIRAIDAICDFPIAVEQLIDRKHQWSSSDGQSSEQTSYQRLLDILMQKPSTRIVVSLTNLLNKIHLFEILKFLAKTCEGENRENTWEDCLIVSLNEILMVYKNANPLLSQPLRSLPASKQFEVKSSPFDSYKAIYKYFKHNNTIEYLANIISGRTPSSADTLDSVLDLLVSMSNCGHGLRFFLSSDSIDSTVHLYKVLIQQCEDSESQIQSVALKLIYRLQVLQLIDLIFGFHSNHEKSKTNKDNFDDPDLLSTLHSLYTMLFTGIGKDAVVQVLSSENNFESILPFICGTGGSKTEAVFPKSVSNGCALELCLVTLQFIDNNLMTFLESYGQTLLKVCENESTPKFQSLMNWLSPIKNVSYNVYNENTFKSLMSVIKKHYDTIRESADALFTPSPELITTVRILQNLCSFSDLCSDPDVQLKYKYAIIQIFSMDGLSQLVFLLNKLSETYLKPSHQSVALIGNQGSLVVNFIKPSVLIIKSMLSYLVSSRTTDFKDVSPIPVLLRVYSVLSLVPSTASQLLNASVAQQIQYEISEILLIYTEVCISGTESDETITKSVWTKMVSHLIDYTLSSPLAFIHGLSLLSDVLPQPLPLVVKQPMMNHEVIKTVNFRKLWSLHLHVLNDRIDALLSSLVSSNIQPIQLLLKRVCTQLCDLSAPTVKIVVKSVFESLLSSLDLFTYCTNDDKNLMMCPTVRILNFILDFSINTPFRLGLLSILSNDFKKEGEDRKKINTLTRLQTVLNKSVQMDSQESAINFILQPSSGTESEPLSDPLEPSKSENTTNESIVSNTETPINSLTNYFINRAIYVLEDDRMVRDWLTTGPNEESDHLTDITDSVKVDLLELSSKYFTDFDIKSNLEKLWSDPLSDVIQPKENGGVDKNIALTNRLPFPRDTNKRIISGRGRGRPFPRTNDPFRSRPPNTSRPPSMHVDDFVALERYDPNSKRANKEFVRPSNRGGNSLRTFGGNQRTSNAGGSYRPNPMARNSSDRYNSRDAHSLSTNRANRSSDPNFSLRNWNRFGDRSYDFRNTQYSRSFH